MDWREGDGRVFVVMVNGATLTFFLIMLTHSFGTLIYSFHSGGDKTRGVLKYFNSRHCGSAIQTSLVTCSHICSCRPSPCQYTRNIWSCLQETTCLCLVVLVLHHFNSVVSVVRGPLYCNITLRWTQRSRAIHHSAQRQFAEARTTPLS